MIDTSLPFVGYLDNGSSSPIRWEVRLITDDKFGPLARVLGHHGAESHAMYACSTLHEVLGVQNAGQLHSSGLRPMPLPWDASKSA